MELIIKESNPARWGRHRLRKGEDKEGDGEEEEEWEEAGEGEEEEEEEKEECEEQLEKEEEGRIKEFKKAIDSTNTLQGSLEKEKERLNDERVAEKEIHFENMRKKWGEHEKEIENHIQMICKNHILEYISQENFPFPRNKPDNTIKISEQYIIFDAKSPLSDDLSNFPTYIKNQTDHDNDKKN